MDNFEIMISAISILIRVCVAIVCVGLFFVKITKFSKQVKKAPTNKVVRSSQRAQETKSTKVHDDRSNDWLAKQLREEKASARMVNSMFDMNYNAKRDHHKNCDADSIDTGTL